MNIAGFASFGSCYSAFHLFGGAVDIIVVEQKDGSYRSTPWYVRFGKFQGVLKGAEKMVRISVNGVEAAFHMYLDNAGEAYFIREVASEKDDDISEVWVLDSLKALVEDVDNGNERSGDDSVSVCGNESNVCGAEDVQFSDDYVLLGTEKCVVDHNNSSDAIDCKNTECIFRSSSELSLERYVEDVNSHDIGSPCIKLGFRQNSGVSQDNCPSSIPYLDSPSTSPLVTAEVDTSDSNALTIDNSACAGSDSVSLHSMISDPEWKDELTSEMQGIEPVEPQIGSSKAGIRPTVGLGFEISRCGKLLHTGMGLRAADEAFEAYRISAEVFKLSASSIIKEENLIVRFKGKYFLWDKAAPLVLGMAAFGLDLLSETNDAILVDDKPPKVSGGTPEITSTSGSRWRLWPLAFRGAKTVQRTTSNLSNEEVFVDSVSGADNQHTELASSPIACNESPCKKLLRTKIPTTQQIASLNLKDGQNIITFSFSSRVLGTQKVDAHIYLWKWNARIVISDVDGTITKSDVLGQVMPLVGKDWTQTGVARLFSAIKENGYELLFLSARAIVQAYLTRTFLLNLKQDGNTLPNGPVVISPDGLFPSLYREGFSCRRSSIVSMDKIEEKDGNKQREDEEEDCDENVDEEGGDEDEAKEDAEGDEDEAKENAEGNGDEEVENKQIQFWHCISSVSFQMTIEVVHM